MNQPSVSSPVIERIPVILLTTIGRFRAIIDSIQRSGRYFAIG